MNFLFLFFSHQKKKKNSLQLFAFLKRFGALKKEKKKKEKRKKKKKKKKKKKEKKRKEKLK